MLNPVERNEAGTVRVPREPGMSTTGTPAIARAEAAAIARSKLSRSRFAPMPIPPECRVPFTCNPHSLTHRRHLPRAPRAITGFTTRRHRCLPALLDAAASDPAAAQEARSANGWRIGFVNPPHTLPLVAMLVRYDRREAPSASASRRLQDSKSPQRQVRRRSMIRAAAAGSRRSTAANRSWKGWDSSRTTSVPAAEHDWRKKGGSDC